MRKRHFYILLFGLLLASCRGNSLMYFDFDNQCLTSHDEQILTNIELTSSDNTEVYIFRKKSGKAGTSCFSFTTLNPDYELEDKLGKPLVNFKLKPSADYTFINNTVGDAVPSKIVIKTDSLGKVYRALSAK